MFSLSLSFVISLLTSLLSSSRKQEKTQMNSTLIICLTHFIRHHTVYIVLSLIVLYSECTFTMHSISHLLWLYFIPSVLSPCILFRTFSDCTLFRVYFHHAFYFALTLIELYSECTFTMHSISHFLWLYFIPSVLSPCILFRTFSDCTLFRVYFHHAFYFALTLIVLYSECTFTMHSISHLLWLYFIPSVLSPCILYCTFSDQYVLHILNSSPCSLLIELIKTSFSLSIKIKTLFFLNFRLYLYWTTYYLLIIQGVPVVSLLKHCIAES